MKVKVTLNCIIKKQSVRIRLQVHMVTDMKMTAFWSIVPYSLIEVDQHFRGARCHTVDGGSMHL
jgi:hypothetical protein